ncbi:VanW family protein [Nocardioides gilvus]|uniref:VanW family protein n=1 Tax=Nocardioides gilvus TaxID=1735589 RepID=UPI0013A56C0E|nr:VanW family protein [Nocardioides gilvus]
MFDSKREASETASDPEVASEEKAGGRVVAGVLLGLVVLAGGSYVVAHQVTGGKVPRGTSVAGVAVGGHEADDAVALLEEGLEERVDAPLELVVGDDEREVTPAEVGLSVDYRESIEATGGSDSWAPERLWTYFTGGGDVDAVVDLDETKFSALVANLDKDLGKKPVNGAIAFDGAEIVTTEAEEGEALEEDVARNAFLAAYLGPSQVVELDMTTQEPEIGADAVNEARNSFANPAVSDPVVLVFDQTRVTLAPADYTRALKLDAEDGALVPSVRPKKLAAVLDDALDGAGGPVDATVALRNGRPVVVPDEPGISYDQDEVNKVFLEIVAAESDQRSAEVEAKTARAEFRTKDAEALGIKEVVSDVSTTFPYATYRNINIGRAAEIINGTVLKPGETFSMNETVGERTRANGFTEGFMIANGVFKEDLGGGVSQMATTLFNGMFFAGLEDVEHKPHSFYISRYPVGREATVAWGSVDLKFKNNTDHGVLIESTVRRSTPGSQGSVRVRMWSTKVWDVSSSTGERYRFTKPETRTLSGPTCVPNSGYGGFDIDVKRVFRAVGSSAVARTENFNTRYTPSDTVICKD